MSLAGHNMAQDNEAGRIPPHELSHLLAIVEKKCGSKDTLKQLCQNPELKKILPDDINQTIDRADMDLSSAVYLVVDRTFAAGNLRPLINALADFKSEAIDPLGKGHLRHFLDEQRSASTVVGRK